MHTRQGSDAAFPFRSWRQEDKHVAIDGVSFQIAFQRCTVDLDVLDRTGFAPGITGGTSVCTWPQAETRLQQPWQASRCNTVVLSSSRSSLDTLNIRALMLWLQRNDRHDFGSTVSVSLPLSH